MPTALIYENINIIKRNTEALLDVSRKVGVEETQRKLYGCVSSSNWRTASQFSDC
jgi:hypothetical protein